MGEDAPVPMEIYGHRGAAGLLPENTLPGFRRAAELGCTGVECDVRGVAGRLAVIHDATVERTTDGRGRVARLGAVALRRLDAGAGPVPWVEELLPLFLEYPTLRWNIELKETAAARLLLGLLEDWPPAVVSRLVVSSFLPQALEPWAGVGVPLALCTGKLTPAGMQQALGLGCTALHLGLRKLRPETVAEVRAAGLAARVYTVNDLATCRRLATLGVQGVFTDRPDLLVRRET